MFDHKHYIPVLRWKQSEWLALRDLTALLKAHMTPIIEPTPNKFNDYNQNNAQKMIGELNKNWGSGLMFVDCHLVADSVQGILLEDLYSLSADADISLNPVIGLERPETYRQIVQDIIGQTNTDVAFRVTADELTGANFRNRIDRSLNDLNIHPQKVHVIIDYGFLQTQAMDFSDIYRCLPHIQNWESLTVLAGAFPLDLTQFYPAGIYRQPRYEWLCWQRAILESKGVRKPSFGDYTIQHPNFIEPPERSNPSASIRYTYEEDWIIMRGEGLRGEDSPGYDQYISNARLLCAQDEFCGARFSVGDQYISDIAQYQNTTGNPGSWLRAGINHHLVFVCQQISGLPD